MIAAVAASRIRDLTTAAALAPPPRATFLPRADCDGAYARYRMIVSQLLPSW
jgi:hypothetical protein